MTSSRSPLLLLVLLVPAFLAAQSSVPAPTPAASAVTQPAPAPAAPEAPKPAAPAAEAPAGPFSKAWTMEDLLPVIADLGPDRNYRNGGRVFQQASCGVCHSFSTFWEGSGLAPDLTPVATKFAREEILRSILEPSATINGQYYFTNFKLKNGTVIPGVLREVKDKTYRIAVSVAAPDAVVEIPEADIVSEENSPVSPMPVGLLNAFNQEQILDLFAFLDSGGNPDAPVYRQK